MHRSVYLIIRLLIWGVSFFICLFPTLIEINRVTLNPFVIAASANKIGKFRDLFFTVVPTSTLAISTLIDFMINHYSETAEDFKGATIICLILNTIALVSGFVGFVLIPGGETYLSGNAYTTYFWMLAYAVILSLVTEAVMALIIHGRR